MNIHDYMAKPDKTIGQHNQDLLNCLEQIISLGYVNNKRVISLLKEACEYHDYGKANSEFQKRVTSKSKKIKFDPSLEIPHNVLSIYFLNKDNYSDKEDYAIIAYAVGYHHNYGNVNDYLENKEDLIKQLLAPFDTYNIRPRLLTKAIRRIKSDKTAILVKGLLHKCDYCASSGVPAELPNNFLQESLAYLIETWQSHDPSAHWNELQQFCKGQQEENIIAIASTGMGKTEAALHWLGNKKGFFVLPLRTAINAMYDRVRHDILKDKNITERLALLHSESAEYLLANGEMDASDVISYNQLGRQFSLPLTITTMDQLFDFVFRYAGYELKLATFSYSKIIIDEIQMYNAELLAYLIYGLEQIDKMGGKIAIITATLVPFVKDKLKDKIHFVEKSFISTKKRHNVKVLDEKINSNDILQLYQKNKESNRRNKILVICNTIKKAQELYRELENDIEDLHMLHSRYIRMDREKLESQIKEFAGSKKVLEEPQKGIWISTSLVEASLDLDFDYLFTELQDLNSLFQRLGRCNRLGLKPIDEVNCLVYVQIDVSLIQCGFIDEEIYKLSKEELLKFAEEKNESLMMEEDKIQMLNQFTTERLKESQYMQEYNEIYGLLEMLPEDATNEKPELRHIQTDEIIPYCIFNKHAEEILSLEEKLHEKGLELEVRIALVQEIKKYTLSIPHYVYCNYRKKLSKGQALNRGFISVSDYEKIPVVGCTYTEKGFESLDDKDVQDPMIW